MSDRSRWFVTTEWLAEHLADPSVIVLDGSWYLPTVPRDAKAEYLEKHIPGAVFFDIDGISDKNSTLPHMLPNAPDFARMVGALGVGDGMKIVAYDASGLVTAPRVWWEFRVFGAPDIVILEGGLPKWIAEGRPLESGEVRREPKKFTPKFNPAMVSTMTDVGQRIAAGKGAVIDGRPADRFYGRAPEPRVGVPSGHIPGSLSVPSGDFVTEGKLKDDAELALLFEKAGVDLSQPVVTSCGSGIAATTLTLAAEILGAKDVAVYDGAWTEWAGHKKGPVATDE
jgi:thiosulfate/3-mercaptopyruvate sulfurtransferase